MSPCVQAGTSRKGGCVQNESQQGARKIEENRVYRVVHQTERACNQLQECLWQENIVRQKPDFVEQAEKE